MAEKMVTEMKTLIAVRFLSLIIIHFVPSEQGGGGYVQKESKIYKSNQDYRRKGKRKKDV